MNARKNGVNLGEGAKHPMQSDNKIQPVANDV